VVVVVVVVVEAVMGGGGCTFGLMIVITLTAWIVFKCQKHFHVHYDCFDGEPPLSILMLAFGVDTKAFFLGMPKASHFST
jgi:hypothetical protein